jgi:FKBP-type peptidyl-prolyl cis-trans isomerase FkpA
MHKFALFLLPAALLAQAPAATSPQAPATSSAASGMTDEQKTIYALGLSIEKSIEPFNLSPEELEIVLKGMSDAAAGKPAIDLNVQGPKIQALYSARIKAVAAGFLEKAAAEPGAEKTASGLIYKEERAGNGTSPKPTDKVKVNYRGTLVNGTEFDSSYKRNQPLDFSLTQVIACWTEGVQKMKVGGKAKLTCPSSIAYGDAGQPPTIPGGATLIFEVELLAID